MRTAPTLRQRAAALLGRAAARLAPKAPKAAWQGGDYTRFTASWMTPTSSINADLRHQLPTLRARSRWLCDNNGYAAGFARACEDGIIGPKGIQLRGEVRTVGGLFVPKTNEALEASWKEWGHPENCDIARRLTWLDFQRLVARTVAIDGECFVRLWRGADNAFGFAVQIIDTDLVDDCYHREASPGVNEIRMGIELDRFGGAVAYHVLTRHPAESGTRERLRIPAEEMLHLFVSLRAGQVRGAPWLSPVLTDAQMLDGYEEAELIRVRVNASQMGLLIPGDDTVVPANAPKDTRFEVQPGQFREVPKGYTVHDWNPDNPGAAFGEFTNIILRSIARGAGVTEMTLTGDVSRANYSSLRAGQAPERDAWRALHQWIIPRLHRPTYRAWLRPALLAGQIAVDSRLASNYQAVSWKGRGWVSVDPLKDMHALKEAIGLGVGSRTRFLAEQGEDFEETIDQLHEEQEYAERESVRIAGIESLIASETPDASDDETPARPTTGAVTPLRRPAMRGLRRLAAGGM